MWRDGIAQYHHSRRMYKYLSFGATTLDECDAPMALRPLNWTGLCTSSKNDHLRRPHALRMFSMMKMSPRGLLSSADAGILQSFGQNILSNNLALVFESTYVVRFVALLPCPYQLFLAYKRRLTPPCSLAVYIFLVFTLLKLPPCVRVLLQVIPLARSLKFIFVASGRLLDFFYHHQPSRVWLFQNQVCSPLHRALDISVL